MGQNPFTNQNRPLSLFTIALLFAAVMGVAFAGCAYVDMGIVKSDIRPDYAAGSIHSIAIIPFGKSWFSASDVKDLTHRLQKIIEAANPSIRIVPLGGERAKLEANDLSEKLAASVRNLEAGRGLDSTTFERAGSVLHVDAVMICEVTAAQYIRPIFFDRNGSLYAAVRYLVFGTRDARLLWESNGDATGLSAFDLPTPSFHDVVLEAQNEAAKGFSF